MRIFLGIVAVYLFAGWLLVGTPSTECTSEQRALNPENCGTGALIRESLAWPMKLLGD